MNPDRVRQDGWLGRLPHKALRVCGVGGHEHLLPGVTHRVGPPVVYDGWRHQPDSRVAMLAVVPGEERLTEDASVIEAAEACREVRAVRQCLELGLGEGVVIAGCVLVTPRSASSHATGLDVMEEPRSACRVNCPVPICCFSQVSVMSRWASTADSARATIQPTTYRLKISRLT